MDDFRSLFDRARAGDGDARGELIERHLPGLRAYVRLKSGRLVRAKESASDLVQSVCREALRDLSRVECDDEAAFRAWLFRVALHKVLGKADYHRAQRRDAARELDGRAAGEGGDEDDVRLLDAYGTLCSPSRDAVVREELARIEAAFDRLSDDQREVILAARFEGRSHREIAEASGRSEEAVRQLLARARARLAMLLDGA